MGGGEGEERGNWRVSKFCSTNIRMERDELEEGG